MAKTKASKLTFECERTLTSSSGKTLTVSVRLFEKGRTTEGVVELDGDNYSEKTPVGGEDGLQAVSHALNKVVAMLDATEEDWVFEGIPYWKAFPLVIVHNLLLSSADCYRLRLVVERELYQIASEEKQRMDEQGFPDIYNESYENERREDEAQLAWLEARWNRHSTDSG